MLLTDAGDTYGNRMNEFSTPCPGLATERFAVLALVRLFESLSTWSCPACARP